MGLNTTVVILNDALLAIEDDPNFGRNLMLAINQRSATGIPPVAVSTEQRGVAAYVIETHHADFTTVVAVGGGSGRVIGCLNPMPGKDEDVQILKSLANHMGYRVVKKHQGE